jgi:hypothetical protein
MSEGEQKSKKECGHHGSSHGCVGMGMSVWKDWKGFWIDAFIKQSVDPVIL